jgi:hypothetical protein
VAAALCLACAGPHAPEPTTGWTAISDSGRLAGQLAPESGAVEIAEFQSWVLELRNADGGAVTRAAIGIAGGMPGHGHGLPTEPRVTEELGDGRYRIDGVKLNMVGAWVIEVFVQTSEGSGERAGLRDRLRFDLAIDY